MIPVPLVGLCFLFDDEEFAAAFCCCIETIVLFSDSRGHHVHT